MALHELVLLNPYRFPGQHSLVLSPEDMACWMNGFTALWHPAALWQAKGPPRCDSAYDHEQPQPGFLYAVPESPALYLPEDWEERVRTAGSLTFKATTDRAVTLENLKAALNAGGEKAPDAPPLGWPEGCNQPAENLRPFFGLGLGHLLEGTLAEAMEHENLLENDAFWDQVQHAVALLADFPYTPTTPPRTSYEPAPSYAAYDYNSSRSNSPDDQGYSPSAEAAPHLTGDGSQQIADTDYPDGSAPPRHPEDETQIEQQAGDDALPEPVANTTNPDQASPPPPHFTDILKAAAERLLSAREVLYPVTIHLLDLVVLDEKNLDQPWPASFAAGQPVNVLASTSLLEKLAQEQPDKMADLRRRVQEGQVEVIGGSYVEREDPYLPLDSQLWNLRRGLDAAKELLCQDIRVFGRKRFGYHPQLPLLLSTNGLTRSLFLTMDESSGLPHYTSCVVAWPSPDGKQVDAFVRAPTAVHDPQHFFNLGHNWYKTTREDHTATLCFSHTGTAPCPWYDDMMALAQLAPVLGNWSTFSRYFETVMPGEHPSAPGADDFHSDFLNERVEKKLADPVSAFARHVRQRRRVDACWTYAALHHALGNASQLPALLPRLTEVENALEAAAPSSAPVPNLDEIEQRITAGLAERLQVRSEPNRQGYLLLNPCAFARRVTLEVEGGAWPLPIVDPVKACQLNGKTLRAVVEVPALGYAWIPKEGPAGTPAMTARIRVADPATNSLRNEFFEVEIDQATGSLKVIRDHKTRVNRLGQRLVFNPGSRMVAKEIQTTLTGPAVGEIVSSGELLGEQDQVLARFKQRFRVWMGRPLLEMRIELEPVQPPAGYPWHAYFGARFAWRDERGVLLRGVSGAGYLTTHPRPQTPDFLELRLGRQGTVIFPGGMPFHQRQEGRMVDVILIPEGEQTTTFDLGIALDREMPQQTALGLVSPLAVVPTSKGAPHSGVSAWLFHIDAPNLLLSRMTPGAMQASTAAASDDPANDDPASPPRQQGAPIGAHTGKLADAVTARLYECGGYSGHAEFRCARNPTRAAILDAKGGFLLSASPSGDAVLLEITPNDLVHLQVEFG